MNSNKIVCSLLIALSVSTSNFAAEKSSAKEKDKKPPEHQRGWIGGEYKLVRSHWSWFTSAETVVAFPKSLNATQKRGLLITALSTNTPAYLAGLREGDLILELDRTKITSLTDFRMKIDEMKPGSPLAVRAYRNEEARDYDVTVGRETYRHQGIFAVSLLPILDQPNLKFNPGFSLIALGLSWDTGKRAELGSPEQDFRRKCSSKQVDVSNRHWRVWLAVIFAEHDHQIRSQEIVAR
jgi:membrane-associated protease RseP (regulator of RpoE activity)